MIFRFIYFLAIGWWLGLFAALAGYVLCLTIIGLPVGTMLLNRLPSLVYLREAGEPCPVGHNHRHLQEELPLLLRAFWFFVLGWSLGFMVITAGYLLAVTVIGIPLGIYLLNRVPLVMTLSRHYGQ